MRPCRGGGVLLPRVPLVLERLMNASPAAPGVWGGAPCQRHEVADCRMTERRLPCGREYGPAQLWRGYLARSLFHGR